MAAPQTAALIDAARRRFALATEVGRYRGAVKLAIAELELALHYPNGGGVAEAIRILKSAVTEIEGRG